MRGVVKSLNDALGDQRLPDERLRESFDVWWPRLETQLATIEQETSAAAPPDRTDRELLEETVNTVRAVACAIDQAVPRPRLWEDRLPLDIRRDMVGRALDALPSRERQVLSLRFGLDGEPKTLEEIGKLLGVSPERVRRLENQALQRLAALRDLRDPDLAALLRDPLLAALRGRDQVSEPENEAS
jgi:RNA polymerase sigma factor (sigma-70 family)